MNQSLIQPGKSLKIAIFGVSGSGKTTWLFQHINEFQPFVLVDPMFDYKFKSLDLYTITSVDEALHIFENQNPQRIYISPNLQAFDYFCALILARGNMTLIVDEVDQYSTSYFIGKYFKRIIKVGRHVGVNVITVCQRPKAMNPYIRSQANRFIVFPMGKEDLKTLESYIVPDVMKLCFSLRSYSDYSEYLDYDKNTRTYNINRINYLTKTS